MSRSGQKDIGLRPDKPRVQIEYDLEDGGAQRAVSLPFVMHVMSDLKGKKSVVVNEETGEREEIDPLAIAEREFVEIGSSNLEDHMAVISPRVEFDVDNKLTGEGGTFKVDMTFQSMKDFTPGRIAEQVPQLNKLLEARNKLKALLTFMDGRQNAENLIKELLADPDMMKVLASAGAEDNKDG